MKEDVVILAHNYVVPELQDIADFVSDSLVLCRRVQEIEKKYILFCGVDFMAETASILNPDKIVLVPDREARCPMAAMLPAEKLKLAKKKYPDAAVVLYVNTLAEAKALADITCTSSNAVEVVKSLDEERILFGPDKNLASYVARNVPEKEIIPIPSDGHCYVHEMFGRLHILKAKQSFPFAEILIHPECRPEVQELAHFICSTEQMVKRARKSKKREFIIATEVGLIYRLRREMPNKEFIPALSSAICEPMKMNTLEKAERALKNKDNIVKVEKKIAEKARKAIERMLEL